MKLKAPVSLTTRLALLFAVTTAGLLIVTGIVLERAIMKHFIELDDHELFGKLALIENLVEKARTPAERSLLPQSLEDSFVGHAAVGVLVRDEAILFAVHPEQFPLDLLNGSPLPQSRFRWEKAGRHYVAREKVFELPPAPGEPDRVAAVVSLDVTHHEEFLESLGIRLWLGILGATLIAAILGWWAAYQGLRPLQRITEAARGLSADHLEARLAETDAPAEVRQLVDALNDMLERLQAAFVRLSDFSADIAHELRTPVSNLMTQTAVALTRSRSNDEYREVLASNMEEYERIARMVSDMLFLAKAQRGLLPHPDERVALGKEAVALAEFYEALAEERQIKIVVGGEATVSGDRLMLRRAISNLMSNALRHAVPESTVDITIALKGPQASISVRNEGEDIPANQLGRIFERFHRTSPDRHRHGEGAGLGLAITRSIVESHGGTVDVLSSGGITVFEILLPSATAVRPGIRGSMTF